MAKRSILLVMCALLASCGYLRDRAKDAADIFTVTAGLGAGAKTRVGPINLGFIFNSEIAGLRGGEFFAIPSESDEEMRGIDLQVLVFGYEASSLTPAMERRDKFQGTANLIVPIPNVGHEMTVRNAPYWTQIDLVAGAGPSVRVGFNPGELVDFLLGWFGIDIYGDDRSRRRGRSEAPGPKP
jgi:hypothetical protein